MTRVTVLFFSIASLWIGSVHSFLPGASPAKPNVALQQSASTINPPTSNDIAIDKNVITETNPLHVVIAGAGVGGLALANALGTSAKVTVVEQTGEFKRFGGPIQLASNALQIVKEMDEELYGKVMEKFTFTGDKQNGIKDGIRTEWYAEFDLKSPAEARGMPYSGVIERPDLQELYLEQLKKHTNVQLKQGNGLVSYEQMGSGNVDIELANGEHIQADVLIGADGIWSKVRQKLRNQKSSKGEGSGAVYSGYTVFAGELKYVAPDHNVVGYKVYIGPGQYFVITDIGKGKYQWYAFLAMPPNEKIEKPDDSTSLYLQETFEVWSPEIHDILKATKEDEIEQRDLYDRKPSRPWCDGNVALLGDGIHAMMPNLGQGGCQAMEDAYVLNQELQSVKHKSQIQNALMKYQQRRWIRASAVQGLSRFASDIIIRGFDTPAKIYWKDGLQFENCNYAGIVTRMLQPFLPIFFKVQFNYLYDGYRNDKTIDVPATIGFTLLGGLIASLLSIEVVEAGLTARWGLGALVGTEGAIDATNSAPLENIQLPDASQFLDKFF